MFAASRAVVFPRSAPIKRRPRNPCRVRRRCLDIRPVKPELMWRPLEFSLAVQFLHRTLILFVSQGIDGVDAAGFDGGLDAEDHAHGDGDTEGDDDGGGGDDGFPFGGAGDEPGEEEAEGNTQESTADGDEDGFGEELADDIEAASADGAADADFAGAFHDGGEDDVHDADAADEEGNGGDGDHDVGKDGLGALLLGEEGGGDGDAEILHPMVSGVEDGGDDLGGFDAIGVGAEAEVDAVEVVFHAAALVPETVLEGVEGDVDDVVDVEHGWAVVLGAGHDLFAEDADDFHPGIVDLDELADGGSVAEEVDFGAFTEDADGGARGVVGLIEELAFGEVEAVDDGVGGLDAIEFGDIAGGFGEDAGGVKGFAGGEGFEGFDVGFEDADVAVGEAWGGAAALLEFLLAGGGAGFDEDVADAELLDEAEGFLAGAGTDGEHADDAADAEDDTEGGEQGTGLLGAEVGAGRADVGEKDHWGPPGGEKAAALRAAGKLKHAPPLRRRKTRAIGRGPSWRRSVERSEE